MSKNKKHPIILGLFFSFIILFLFPLNTYGEGAPISVKAILPESQVDSGVTFFDLKLEPGQVETLKVRLFNTSDKDQKVRVQVNTARTSDGGSIDYSTKTTEDNKDSSMKVSIADLISLVEPIVTVPAQKDIEVAMDLKMPNEPFDGMLLGGVHIGISGEDNEKEEKKEKSSGKGGMAIENKLAYVIGLKVVETDTEVQADLKYERAYAAQSAGRNQVNINLQNPKKMALNSMSYEAKIYKKGSDEVLHESKDMNYRVAPNTNFNYVVGWDNKPFKAGTYRVKMTAENDETDQSWSWDEEFTITAEEAKKLNEKAVELDEDNTTLYIAIALGILAIIIVIIAILMRRKKKREKERRRRNKSKSKSKSKSNKSRKGSHHGKR